MTARNDAMISADNPVSHISEPAAGRPPRAAGMRPRRLLPLGLLLPLVLLALWEFASEHEWLPGTLLPAPSVIVATLADLWRSGELIDHIIATTVRVVFGFALGVAAATVLGALCGASTLARRLLDPTIQGLKSVPSLAWVPLFILWFGIFETSKVLLIAVGIFFPVYLALAAGIPSVDRKLVEVARVYRYSSAALIGHVLLPSVLPTYLIGLRSGLALGWMFVVAAELMGASQGLGYLLVDGQQTGKPSIIIASIILFAILGKLTDLALAIASSRALRWQDSIKSQAG
jgi:sulfonate transport system permease protein